MARHTPWEWQHLICSCDEPIHTEHINSSNKCGKCGLYFRYALLPCADCNKEFLKNFKHPQWCSCSPRCWACCNEADYRGEDYCERSRCVARFSDIIVPPPASEDPREVPNIADVTFELDLDF